MNNERTRFGGTTHWVRARWLVVVIFALAMAWVEAAVVLDLRTLIGRIDPYQPRPLPHFGGLEAAEVVREVATMIMLVTIGWLAGHNHRTRIGYSLLAFGIWDIFYYVYLRLLTGWPRTLLDWDVLFLIPLPWWGPVLAPTAIAVLMIVWGTLMTQTEQSVVLHCPTRKALLLMCGGVLLALYVFMADALRVVGAGEEALRNLLPESFNWVLFGMAWLLMATPVMEIALCLRGQRTRTETVRAAGP